MSGSIKKKVLVVEDEPDVRTYLAALFADMGFEVTEAGDGREAIKLARTARPDLITLDIVMPQSTGMRFYRELKEDPALARVPVIIITGLQKDFETFMYHRKAAAPDGYLNKPFDHDTLQAEVGRVLRMDVMDVMDAVGSGAGRAG